MLLKCYYIFIYIAGFLKFCYCKGTNQPGVDNTIDKKYMIYFVHSPFTKRDDRWLCGGALVSPTQILTAAACLVEAENIYAIAGYKKYVNSKDIESDECTRARKQRVVKILVPTEYMLAYENPAQWINVDVGVAIVEKPYNFSDLSYRIYCSYEPQPVYVNFENKYELASTHAVALGWGDMAPGNQGVANSQVLQESSTVIVDKTVCANTVNTQEIVYIIEKYLLCASNNVNDASKETKVEKETNKECKVRRYDLTRAMDSNGCYEDDFGFRRTDAKNKTGTDKEEQNGVKSPTNHTGTKNDTNANYFYTSLNTRTSSASSLGPCQSGHGCPLIRWVGDKEVVIGVASNANKNDECKRPFLYVSTAATSKIIKCLLETHSMTRKFCNQEISDKRYEVQEIDITWPDFTEKPPPLLAMPIIKRSIPDDGPLIHRPTKDIVKDPPQLQGRSYDQSFQQSRAHGYDQPPDQEYNRGQSYQPLRTQTVEQQFGMKLIPGSVQTNEQLAKPFGSPLEGPVQQFESPPGQQFKSPPEQQYDAPPGQQYDQPPAPQYEPPLGQQYDSPPEQQYASPPGQQYESQPGQQFGPPMGHQYEPPPGQQFEPPLGQEFETLPGQQFEIPQGQQYEPPPVPQYESPQGPQYEPQLGQQYEPQLGQQYEPQLGQQYEPQLGQQYEQPLRQQYEPPPGQQYAPKPGQQNESPPGQQYAPPPGQQNEPPLGQQYEPPLGQQYETQPGSQYESPPREQYEPLPGHQNEQPLGQKYDPPPGQQYELPPRQQFNLQSGSQYEPPLGQHFKSSSNQPSDSLLKQPFKSPSFQTSEQPLGQEYETRSDLPYDQLPRQYESSPSQYKGLPTQHYDFQPSPRYPQTIGQQYEPQASQRDTLSETQGQVNPQGQAYQQVYEDLYNQQFQSPGKQPQSQSFMQSPKQQPNVQTYDQKPFKPYQQPMDKIDTRYQKPLDQLFAQIQNAQLGSSPQTGPPAHEETFDQLYSHLHEPSFDLPHELNVPQYSGPPDDGFEVMDHGPEPPNNQQFATHPATTEQPNIVRSDDVRVRPQMPVDYQNDYFFYSYRRNGSNL